MLLEVKTKLNIVNWAMKIKVFSYNEHTNKNAQRFFYKQKRSQKQVLYYGKSLKTHKAESQLLVLSAKPLNDRKV